MTTHIFLMCFPFHRIRFLSFFVNLLLSLKDTAQALFSHPVRPEGLPCCLHSTVVSWRVPIVHLYCGVPLCVCLGHFRLP